MNTITILHNDYTEQAHAEFHELMQKVQELICNAWADATSDAERDELRKVEEEINAAICTPDVREKINGVWDVLNSRHIYSL